MLTATTLSVPLRDAYFGCLRHACYDSRGPHNGTNIMTDRLSVTHKLISTSASKRLTTTTATAVYAKYCKCLNIRSSKTLKAQIIYKICCPSNVMLFSFLPNLEMNARNTNDWILARGRTNTYNHWQGSFVTSKTTHTSPSVVDIITKPRPRLRIRLPARQKNNFFPKTSRPALKLTHPLI